MRLSSGLVLGIASLLVASAALADGGANHQSRQTRPIQMGTSGGNVNDRSSAFCCSGTLGSLVTDGTRTFILSNNHVLARVNAGAAGEAINQPGNIDVGCADNPADYVANLTRFVSLNFSRNGNNTVDCAIAEATSGSVQSSGSIIDIGSVSGTPLAASVGLGVKKSGRTTGLTTGTVTGINGSVAVQYQQGCGKGKKVTANFTGQIVFSDISDGGDSGSLIVENTGSCPRPVGLLFAGSSTQTIGNPISNVLSSLGVSMVHGSCPAGPAFPENVDLTVQHAIQVQGRVTERLMQIPGVSGTSIGMDGAGRAVIQVYLDSDDAGVRSQIPAQFEDVPSRIIVSGPFVAY